jgi:hypothetical protein
MLSPTKFSSDENNSRNNHGQGEVNSEGRIINQQKY